MRLDETDRAGGLGVDVEGGPGALEGEQLAVDAGVHDARLATVGGDPGGADDGVDCVAVTHGVFQALEDDRAEALADQETVSVRGEGADLAAA